MYNNLTVIKIISISKIYNLFIPNQYKIKKIVGTGFFISINGLLLTCYDNIKFSKYIITYINNKKYNIKLLSICPEKNLALLKILNYNNEYLLLGEINNNYNSNYKLVGYCLKNNNIKSILVKIIKCNRYIYINKINGFKKGGVLLDLNNKVIGIYVKNIYINNTKYFKILPIYEFLCSIIDYMNKKIVKTPKLYIEFKKYKKNIIITDISKFSPFYNKLNIGDIILNINKSNINELSHMDNLLNNKNIYDHLNIEYIHNNNIVFKKIILDTKLDLPLNYINFPFEKIKYLILGGLIFTELSINHLLELKKYNLINDSFKIELFKYYNYKYRINKKVFISYSYNNKYDLLIGCIVNNSNIYTINDLLKLINNYNNNEIIINCNNSQFILNINDCYEFDKYYSKIYNYKINYLI